MPWSEHQARLQAVGVLRLAPVIAIATFLSGCVVDQSRQFHQCRLDAIKLYPQDEGGPWSRTSTYIYSCMEAAGYTLKVGGYCQIRGEPRDRIFREECYVPTGLVAHWIYNVEMRLTGRPIDDR
jgi:hypothetical protein